MSPAPDAGPAIALDVRIEADSTKATVSSEGRVVSEVRRLVGSDGYSEALVNYVKHQYKLLIGQQTAEELWLEIGSATPLIEEVQGEIRGRDLVSGLPKTAVLTSEETRQALDETLCKIAAAVRDALISAPRDVRRGAVNALAAGALGGGVSGYGQIQGIEVRLATTLRRELADDGAPSIVTRPYIDIELPERFILEYRDSHGAWIDWGRYPREDAGRLEDGTYVWSGHPGSPLFLRCTKQRGELVDLVDEDGNGYTRRLVALPNDRYPGA